VGLGGLDLGRLEMYSVECDVECREEDATFGDASQSATQTRNLDLFLITPDCKQVPLQLVCAFY
jgi:hypothetical protein